MSLVKKTQEFYDFSVKDLNDNLISMEKYRGMIVLIVNTVSVGKEREQLGQLEALQEAYKRNGFTVVAFPCHDFKIKDPISHDDIRIAYRDKNRVTFDLYAPLKVTGTKAHPLYRWLKKKKIGQFGKEIESNFCKFLISRDGRRILRFTEWRDFDHIGKKIREMFTHFGRFVPETITFDVKPLEVKRHKIKIADIKNKHEDEIKDSEANSTQSIDIISNESELSK